jgi:hypothetical protein
MKTFLLLAAGAAAALVAAAPAAFAQRETTTTTVYPAAVSEAGNWTLKRREDWLNEHINKAHDVKDIDDREADRAHHALDRIRDDENRMRGHHDGQLTDNETTDLEARLDQMAETIHAAQVDAFKRPW